MNEFKKLVKSFKQNPALGFAIIIVLVAILYYVYKQNNSGQGNVQAQAADSNIPSYILYDATTQAGSGNGGTTPPPTTPPPGAQTYTLTKADLSVRGPLHHLAARFGITYDELFAANSPSPLGTDKNHAKFAVGTKLTIPSSSSSTSNIPAGSQ